MGLPKEYNKALHQHANFYAAWFPVTMPYQVGDYGLIQNGVFQKIGHLDQLKSDGFNVDIQVADGPPTSIDFLSEGAKMVKIVAGAEVPQLPAANIEASVKFKFEKENSFALKASEIRVKMMQNAHEVAKSLAVLRRNKKWSHQYRVVSATYTGQNCLVLLSRESGTEVGFDGEASALKQLELGKITLKPSVSFSNDTVLKSIGDTGVIGLNLFKLKWMGNVINVLKGSDISEEESSIEDSWDHELDDDDL